MSIFHTSVARGALLAVVVVGTASFAVAPASANDMQARAQQFLEEAASDGVWSHPEAQEWMLLCGEAVESEVDLTTAEGMTAATGSCYGMLTSMQKFADRIDGPVAMSWNRDTLTLTADSAPISDMQGALKVADQVDQSMSQVFERLVAGFNTYSEPMVRYDEGTAPGDQEDEGAQGESARTKVTSPCLTSGSISGQALDPWRMRAGVEGYVDGDVNDDLKIPASARVLVNGDINGDLAVKAGATAVITGMVNGDVDAGASASVVVLDYVNGQVSAGAAACVDVKGKAWVGDKGAAAEIYVGD